MVIERRMCSCCGGERPDRGWGTDHGGRLAGATNSASSRPCSPTS